MYHIKKFKYLSQSFWISRVSVTEMSSREWLNSTRVTMDTDVGTIPQPAQFPSPLLVVLQFLIDSATLTDSASNPLLFAFPKEPNADEYTRVSYTSGN